MYVAVAVVATTIWINTPVAVLQAAKEALAFLAEEHQAHTVPEHSQQTLHRGAQVVLLLVLVTTGRAEETAGAESA
jgi:hypothetical protein